MLLAAEGQIDVSHYYNELDMFNTLRDCFRERLLSENEEALQESLIRRVSKEQDSIFREFYSQPGYYRLLD